MRSLRKREDAPTDEAKSGDRFMHQGSWEGTSEGRSVKAPIAPRKGMRAGNTFP